MNQNIAKGAWKEIKGKIKTQWGRLTNDELDELEGNLESLAGRVQRAYGRSQDEARKEVEDFYHSNEMHDHEASCKNI